MENHAARPEFVAALQWLDWQTILAAATLSAFHFSTWRPRSQAAPCAWLIRCRSWKPPVARVRRGLLFGSGLGVCGGAGRGWIRGTIDRAPAATHRRVRRKDCRRRSWRHAFLKPPTTRSVRSPPRWTRPPASWRRALPRLENSQRQLETLLNSMQDAVIAVGADERVQWANRSMDKLVPQPARLQCAGDRHCSRPRLSARGSLRAGTRKGLRRSCAPPFRRDAPTTSPPLPCPEAALLPFFATSPKRSAWKRPGGTSSPTCRTNCALL